MVELLDAGWLRVAGYFVAAAAALASALRDRRLVDTTDATRWPTFGYLSAALLVTMAVARGGGLGDLIADFGRDQARASGWYGTRRNVQTLAVMVVAGVWAVVVGLAIWRVPERRRRYLPAAIAMFSLVCFAAVRIVSLHHVDALLYNRDIAGLRFVSIFELSGLAASVTAMFWYPFVKAAPRRPVSVDA